jgi:uncharacterized protein YjhX (UPF0386 family)
MDVFTPAWLVILGHLYRHRDETLPPTWLHTPRGMETALDLPYVTVIKSLTHLVREGYVIRDEHFIVGKQRAVGDSRRRRRGQPYRITEAGIRRFENIEAEVSGE